MVILIVMNILIFWMVYDIQRTLDKDIERVMKLVDNGDLDMAEKILKK